jgi:hypothetical protein
MKWTLLLLATKTLALILESCNSESSSSSSLRLTNLRGKILLIRSAIILRWWVPSVARC